jgi:hypothetical protein
LPLEFTAFLGELKRKKELIQFPIFSAGFFPFPPKRAVKCQWSKKLAQKRPTSPSTLMEIGRKRRIWPENWISQREREVQTMAIFIH